MTMQEKVKTADALLELAERCEKVTDEWRTADLSADIYEALGYSVIRGGQRVCWRYRGHGPFGFNSHWVSMRRFTRSVDDALELVPSGWEPFLETDIRRDNQWLLWRWGLGHSVYDATHGESFHAALALCAAALRARAQPEGFRR